MTRFCIHCGELVYPNLLHVCSTVSDTIESPRGWRGDSPTDASRFSNDVRTLVTPVEWRTYKDVTIGLAPVKYLETFRRTVSSCLRCGTQMELMLILIGEHEDEWICAGCLDLALGELEND